MMRINKLNVVLAIVSVLSVVFVGYNSIGKNKEVPKEYHINKIVQSIDKNIEVEQQTGKGISANEMLNEHKFALVYRMKDGEKQFPDYVTPSKISVDPYDNIIMIYDDEGMYKEQLAKLIQDERTEFAEEMRVDDLKLEEDISESFITVNTNSGHNSYAPELMNTDVIVDELNTRGINKKLTIGFIDTGLYSKNSVPAEFVNFSESYDYFNEDNNVCDGIDTHATMVVSSYLDIVGKNIASKTNIVIGKALENGVGSHYDVYLAIMDMSKSCDVINMSIGGEAGSELMEFAVNEAKKNGCILVCASGNESSSVAYPAKYDYTIAVSAIDANKEITYFSNTGDEIDFTAPGERIVVDAPEYSQRIVNGTSFSAPIMTGVCQLAMLDENLSDKKAVVDYLKLRTIDLGEVGKDKMFGYGLVFFEKQEEEPDSSESETEQPTTEQPTTEQPTTEQPTTEQPTTEQPTTERPTTEQPTTEQPTTEQPTTEQPTTEQPTTEQPTTERPTTTKPSPQPSKKLAIVESAYHAGTSYGNDYCSRYSFKNVANATHYEVFKCDYHGEDLWKIDSLNWRKIGTTTSTVYYDYDISSDRVFLVKIRAVDSEGNYGEFSKPFEVNNYRYSPTINVSNVFSDKVTVSWTAYESYGHTGYTIYLYEGTERYPSEIIPVSSNKLSYQVKGLEAKTKYRVLVFANKNEISYGESVGMIGTSATSVEFTTR